MSKSEGELYKKAQRMLIASLIHDGSDATKVFEIISPDNFQEPALQIIAEAILELVRTDTPISSISISKELENEGQLKVAGGIQEIYALKEEGRKYLLDNPITLYAAVVKEASAKFTIREQIKVAEASLTEDSGVTAAEAISLLQSGLNDELFKLSDDSTTTELNESIDEYLDLLDERKRISEENAKNAGGLQGIPSMLPTINKVTTGWLPGQLITIGARTGIGKSVFAVNSAVAAAEANKSVLFFSLEMSASELQDRIISSMSGVLLNKIKQGDINEEDRSALKETTERASKMKILIDVDPNITINAIRSKALKRAQSEEGLDLIIIDYLQLITSDKVHGSRQETVANLSRDVKLLAKTLGVPVMILVQMHREKDDDEQKIPQLHQIRESGAIAQDSDIVILLHRDKTVDGEIPDTLSIIAKHRNGKEGDIIRCSSHLEYSMFREIKRSKDAEKISDEDLDSLIDDEDLEELDLSDIDSDLDFGDDFDD